MLLEHRTADHDNTAKLPDAVDRDQKLWDILEVQGHAITSYHALFLQRRRKGRALTIKFRVAHRLIEVIDRGLVGQIFGSIEKHRQTSGGGYGQFGWDVTGILFEPGVVSSAT